jgi:hypothetical protein
MGVNIDNELARGSKQSIIPGDSAVYKSGDEPNGVRDESANNVGQQNVPMKDGKVDLTRVGDPVDFGNGLDGFKNWVISSKEGGLVSVTCNYALPGCNDMSLTHDPLANYLAKNYPQIPTLITNQGTIIPAYIYNTYGLIGKPVNMAIDYLFNTRYRNNFDLNRQNQIPAPTLSMPNFNQTTQR